MHASIVDFLLDIGENAIEAGASLVIVDYLQRENRLEVCISDNGKGMSPEQLNRVKDPFFTDGEKHPKRKVGLGIPFLIMATEAAGGRFDIRSEEGEGTSVYFSFDLSHIDCPPVGELPDTVLSLLLFDRNYELVFNRRWEEQTYSVSRQELIEALGELFSVESVNLARKYLVSLEEDNG